MASLNKVFLIGNLTRDPEIRYTPSGAAVANLGLAVSRKFRDKNQELREEVCFLTVVVWSKMAESCSQYLKKGSPLFVEGRLTLRTWEDAATGKKRSVIEVRAERVQFLGRFNQGSSATPEESAPAVEASSETGWIEENEEKSNENQ
ncbi:MAG: single-stranded DNA-binding protein [Candidatus Omnitrophica bacterium]|nr:single-stranded DNA-binding protein [Candidatus Omnitrophota bacterium]